MVLVAFACARRYDVGFVSQPMMAAGVGSRLYQVEVVGREELDGRTFLNPWWHSE